MTIMNEITNEGGGEGPGCWMAVMSVVAIATASLLTLAMGFLVFA